MAAAADAQRIAVRHKCKEAATRVPGVGPHERSEVGIDGELRVAACGRRAAPTKQIPLRR